jgi:hypothetical protein
MLPVDDQDNGGRQAKQGGGAWAGLDVLDRTQEGMASMPQKKMDGIPAQGKGQKERGGENVSSTWVDSCQQLLLSGRKEHKKPLRRAIAS